METYHKINAPFMRHMENGPQKGKLIMGQWSRPEFEYLADCDWEFTEKVDGTNIRVNLSLRLSEHTVDVRFAGRSDNAAIPQQLLWALEGLFGDATANKRLTDWMVDYDLQEVTLYGEGYGPKIQGGGKYRDDHSFVLFDVKIGDFWLDRKNVNDIADKLEIEAVPVLGQGSLWQAISLVKYGTAYTPNEIKAIQMSSDRDWLSEVGGMSSRWGPFVAEGLVIRPVVPLFNRKGERIITKIKVKDFL